MTPISLNLLVVLGPTASGKTELAVSLAREFKGEIISADSRQVYRGLNLGAGKDLQTYTQGGTPVPYHLIDIADLSEEFSVFDFQQHFIRAFAGIALRGALPILAGGTGLYLESVLKPYPLVQVPENFDLRQKFANTPQPELVNILHELKSGLHNRTDLEDRERIIRAIEIATYTEAHPAEPFPALTPLILGVRWPREELRKRIALRLRQRLDAGLVEEVAGLQQQGITWERLHRLGLEYRLVADFLLGRIASQNELFEKLHLAICDFAKRQETWFRRMERQGFVIHWVDRADAMTANKIVAQYAFFTHT